MNIFATVVAKFCQANFFCNFTYIRTPKSIGSSTPHVKFESPRRGQPKDRPSGPGFLTMTSSNLRFGNHEIHAFVQDMGYILKPAKSIENLINRQH